jgi:hypothetical protein
MSESFVPSRRNIRYTNCREAKISSLLEQLSFTRGVNNWGYRFRFGHFEIKIIEEITRFKELDEPRFLEPISEGKWSVKEIIGHLFYWDKFILEKHFPSMDQGAVLISFPDHDEHNSEAIQYISTFKTTNSLIDKFVEKRRQLIEMMSGIESDVILTIGSGVSLTLYSLKTLALSLYILFF